MRRSWRRCGAVTETPSQTGCWQEIRWRPPHKNARWPTQCWTSCRNGGHRSDLYNDLMVRQLTATEAKATLLALLDAVAAGEEVEITKHGHTVARLVPAAGPSALEGRLAGLASTVSPDEELFSTGEIWTAS